ncbi:MAG TPA: MMPL family transporter [Streptosporangiaceae bacterium]|nr:MMPL family transporter [Streptosporangiaceae bacterium]
MAGSLDRLGRYCVRHRRGIFEIWFVLVLGFGYLGMTHGGLFVQQPRLPGTETQRAVDAMRQDFPQMTGPTATIVFTPQKGVRITDWRVALNVGQAIDNVAKLDRIAFVENPYAPGMGGLKNNRAVVAYVHFKGTMRDVTGKDLTRLESATEQARKAGVDVRFGGIVSMILNQPKSGPAEGIGVFLALVVLLLAFGSFLAAGIPIIVSLFALGVSYSLIHFGAALTDVHPVAPLVAAMLGLGAGIDYALFVVTRYRHQLRAGDDVETAVGRALGTAGHAVVFAGGTVVFAICGLWLSGITFVGRIGLATACAVIVTVSAALTLLPAALGSLGTRVDRLRLPRVRPDRDSPRWNRWGRHVDRHPWPYALVATMILVVLALPALSLRFGIMADSTMPKNNTARQAYDIVAANFGPGYYSPIVVVAKAPGRHPEPAKPKPKPKPQGDVPTVRGIEGLTGLTAPAPANSRAAPRPVPAAPARTQGPPPARSTMGLPAVPPKGSPAAERLAKDLRARLREVPGLKTVVKPVVARDTAIIQIIPTSGPHEQATADLIHHIRGSEIPAVAGRHPGAEIHLGGETPAVIDLADLVKKRMAVVVGAVIGVALVLLMVAFRSVLVPVKAAVMNLLSIGASYGLVVAVFQWGWGLHLIGMDEPIPIVSFVPLFMFATIFGLSMDYEVFLLSRIKEEYDRTGDPHGSVTTGIASTARLITSAALIMIFVFLSFLPQPDATIKMMSIGLAAAVAVDATIVRLVLVPALMSLLGHANWWFPGRRRTPPPPDDGVREHAEDKERVLSSSSNAP